uniref:Uncharacterized protein n=1 Tax=Bracon brevicornis TaxID=1563983 RepID=A0A6V7LN50_9HYME
MPTCISLRLYLLLGDEAQKVLTDLLYRDYDMLVPKDHMRLVTQSFKVNSYQLGFFLLDLYLSGGRMLRGVVDGLVTVAAIQTFIYCFPFFFP